MAVAAAAVAAWYQIIMCAHDSMCKLYASKNTDTHISATWHSDVGQFSCVENQHEYNAVARPLCWNDVLDNLRLRWRNGSTCMDPVSVSKKWILNYPNEKGIPTLFFVRGNDCSPHVPISNVPRPLPSIYIINSVGFPHVPYFCRSTRRWVTIARIALVRCQVCQRWLCRLLMELPSEQGLSTPPVFCSTSRCFRRYITKGKSSSSNNQPTRSMVDEGIFSTFKQLKYWLWILCSQFRFITYKKEL